MKSKQSLNIKEVMKQFERQEDSKSPHKGTFKIDAPFDKALKTILKAKPEARKGKKRG